MSQCLQLLFALKKKHTQKNTIPIFHGAIDFPLLFPSACNCVHIQITEQPPAHTPVQNLQSCSSCHGSLQPFGSFCKIRPCNPFVCFSFLFLPMKKQGTAITITDHMENMGCVTGSGGEERLREWRRERERERESLSRADWWRMERKVCGVPQLF